MRNKKQSPQKEPIQSPLWLTLLLLCRPGSKSNHHLTRAEWLLRKLHPEKEATARPQLLTEIKNISILAELESSRTSEEQENLITKLAAAIPNTPQKHQDTERSKILRFLYILSKDKNKQAVIIFINCLLLLERQYSNPKSILYNDNPGFSFYTLLRELDVDKSLLKFSPGTEEALGSDRHDESAATDRCQTQDPPQPRDHAASPTSVASHRLFNSQQSHKQGAGSREQGAGSREQRAESKAQSVEHIPYHSSTPPPTSKHLSTPLRG